MLVDSSGLLAAIDAGEPDHEGVREAIERVRSPLVTTDLVLAEVDFLVLKRLGVAAELELVGQLVDGVFRREPITELDLVRAGEIIEAYRDHPLGLTDATLMALSERLGVREVLTLDRRHFALFRDRRGRALTLLPHG